MIVFICRLRLCQFSIGLLVCSILCLLACGLKEFVYSLIYYCHYVHVLGHPYRNTNTNRHEFVCLFFFVIVYLFKCIGVYVYVYSYPYGAVQQLAYTYVFVSRATATIWLPWNRFSDTEHTFFCSLARSLKRSQSFATASTLFIEWMCVKFCFHLRRCVCWCERNYLFRVGLTKVSSEIWDGLIGTIECVLFVPHFVCKSICIYLLMSFFE